jgi:hypothetical protein
VPRFNRKDALDLKNARDALKNSTANAEEKASAERTITRLNTDRTRRIEAKRSAGTEPKPDDFETPEQYQSALLDWWGKLDQLAAERDAKKILADPTASTLVRNRAYERLGLRPPEIDQIAESTSVSPTKTTTATVHSLSDSEFAEERRREQKFYDEIAEMLAAEKAKEQHP